MPKTPRKRNHPSANAPMVFKVWNQAERARERLSRAFPELLFTVEAPTDRPAAWLNWWIGHKPRSASWRAPVSHTPIGMARDAARRGFLLAPLAPSPLLYASDAAASRMIGLTRDRFPDWRMWSAPCMTKTGAKWKVAVKNSDYPCGYLPREHTRRMKAAPTPALDRMRAEFKARQWAESDVRREC